MGRKLIELLVSNRNIKPEDIVEENCEMEQINQQLNVIIDQITKLSKKQTEHA